MLGAIVVIFIIAYAAIALEHPIKINKGASALVGAGLLWTVYAIFGGDHALVEPQLRELVGSTAGIVFFLIGAMTIVEVIDAHNGFEVITSQIRTRKQTTLMWIVCFVTFFLSAVLDNLTTTIVMISLMKKLSGSQSDRLFFAAMIVIAANAGGAWSVIGDVTTTMLWIGGQITPLPIIKGVFLPSLINLLLPLFVVTYLLKGKAIAPPSDRESSDRAVQSVRAQFDFLSGAWSLDRSASLQDHHSPATLYGNTFRAWHSLGGRRADPSRQGAGRKEAADFGPCAQTNRYGVDCFLHRHSVGGGHPGAHPRSGDAGEVAGPKRRPSGRYCRPARPLSAIVDNVPLVAASMGMYSVAQYPADSFLWEFIAYCAGTGGSILIIGSAAGVAAMGLEKIHFFWYVKRISGLALLGYLGGAAVYIVQYGMLH